MPARKKLALLSLCDLIFSKTGQPYLILYLN